jgi:hypothetical protein
MVAGKLTVGGQTVHFKFTGNQFKEFTVDQILERFVHPGLSVLKSMYDMKPEDFEMSPDKD